MLGPVSYEPHQAKMCHTENPDLISQTCTLVCIFVVRIRHRSVLLAYLRGEILLLGVAYQECLNLKLFMNIYMERTLMKSADNAGTDQPAHSPMLIRAYVFRLQNRRILWYVSMNRECPNQTAWMDWQMAKISKTPDKREYKVKSFLISRQKYMLCALIRSASHTIRFLGQT